MNPQNLIGAPVALQAPDGRVFRFHVAALGPFRNDTYAVLEEESESGQMLVTLVEVGEDHIPSFLVQGDEEIITGVMETLVARTIAHSLEGDEACHCGHDQGDCSCGHGHHHDGCSCGHDHHHHHDGCSCGHHH